MNKGKFAYQNYLIYEFRQRIWFFRKLKLENLVITIGLKQHLVENLMVE